MSQFSATAKKLWAGEVDEIKVEIWTEGDDVLVYQYEEDGSMDASDDRVSYLALCAMTVEKIKSGAILLDESEKVPTRFKITITGYADVPTDPESRLKLNYRLKSRAMKLLHDMKRELNVSQKVNVKVETDK